MIWLAIISSLLVLGEGVIDLELIKTKDVQTYNSLRRREIKSSNSQIHLSDGSRTPTAAYIAKMKIGQQEFRVVCDTGSSDLIVIGQNCMAYHGKTTCKPTGNPEQKCNADDPNTPTLSTGKSTGQSGSICYGDKNDYTFANYEIYTDSVEMAGISAPVQYLGKINEQSSHMWGQGKHLPQGLMGLAFDSLSVIKSQIPDAKPLVDTLVQHGNIEDSFSMCFNRDGAGGRMILGGGKLTELTYTKITSRTYYTVDVSSMTIGGKSVGNTKGLTTIVDSGTSSLTLPAPLFDQVNIEICEVFAKLKSPCFSVPGLPPRAQKVKVLTPEQLATLPVISITLKGADPLLIYPEAYYVKNVAWKDAFYYEFFISSNSLTIPETPKTDQVYIILGDAFLMGKWVYFDRSNMEIGIKSLTNCYANNLTEVERDKKSGKTEAETKTENAASLMSLNIPLLMLIQLLWIALF